MYPHTQQTPHLLQWREDINAVYLVQQGKKKNKKSLASSFHFLIREAAAAFPGFPREAWGCGHCVGQALTARTGFTPSFQSSPPAGLCEMNPGNNFGAMISFDLANKLLSYC